MKENFQQHSINEGQNKKHKSDVETVILSVNMQEGMWLSESVDNDPSIPEDMRKILKRNLQRADEYREKAMGLLAEEIQSFTNDVRKNGAHIVWVLSDTKIDERWGGIHNAIRADENSDQFIYKKAKSAYQENESYFKKIKSEAQQQGKELQIKVCGVWANSCIANTVIDLAKAGYDVQAIDDMIQDFGKPWKDMERPGKREEIVISAMEQELGQELGVKSAKLLDCKEMSVSDEKYDKFDL